MDVNEHTHELMNAIIERKGISRRGHKIEGMPGDPKSRHTCVDCGHKRYESLMIPLGRVKENNFKAWLLWRCIVCKEDHHDNKFIH